MATSAITPIAEMNAANVAIFINMGAWWEKASVELLYGNITLLLISLV